MAMTRTQVFFSAAVVVGASFTSVAFSPMALAQGVVSEWTSVKPPPVPELKNITIDPMKTAILVVDFSAGCTMNPRCVVAIPKVKELLDKARASHTLVVYTAYGNMKPLKDVQSIPDVEQTVVGHANKFADTDLDKILKAHGITTVIAMGETPNGGPLFTCMGAASLGYKVIVPVDTIPGSSPYAEQMAIWAIANDPVVGNVSTLTSVDKIMF
jgi:nicotinamidase-related amidase